jgi:hypothetical protein
VIERAAAAVPTPTGALAAPGFIALDDVHWDG